MTESEIYAGLNDIFRTILDDESITLRAELTAADVKGWDSLRMVSIAIAVERRFSVRLRTREINELECVGDFVRLIERKLAA
jgi:acyl carrier protein